MQPRRTALAWSRTALAMGADALLVMRAGLQGHDQTLLLLGIALSVAAVGLAGAGWWRHRQLARAHQRAVPQLLMAFTTGAVVLAAVGVLWSVRP